MKVAMRFSTTNKIFWVLLTPTFIVSLLASFFLLTSHFNNLDKNLYEHTEQLTKQAAMVSEYAIVHSDKEMMNHILKSTLNHKNINSIQILSGEQKVIAELGETSSSIDDLSSVSNHIQEYESYLTSISEIRHTTPPKDNTSIPQTNSLTSLSQQDLIIGWIKVEASKSAIKIEKYQYASLVIVIITLFNIFNILVAAYISKKLVKPLNIISSSLNRLVQGQFSTAKLITLPSEYIDLQKDLLDLTEKLENHESIESSRLESQFITKISHQIRPTLNAILDYTKILRKSAEDIQQRLYVETIDQSTNNLLTIIDDTLNLSKIESGKLNLENTHFNLKSLIEEIYQTLSIHLLTKEKRIDLIPEFDEDVPECFIGDNTKVRQILTNLIDNAIKFTYQGSIRTKVSILSNDVKKVTLSFQIIDTGIGIPDHKINKLFKPFSQAGSNTTRKFGRTGLGLITSKNLVEQMNGKIEVSSDLGIGSTFHFTLCLRTSVKTKNNRTPLNRHVILFEPSTAYRNYINKYLNNIGVNCSPYSDLEQTIRFINKQKNATDAILLNITPDQQGIKEAQELIAYALQQFNIACILIIQPSRKIGDYSNLKHLCSDILLNPVSQDRLYDAIKNINNPMQIESSEPQRKADINKLSNLKALAVDNTPSNLQRPNTIETWCATKHSFEDQVDKTLIHIFNLEKALEIVDGNANIAKEMFDIFADSLNAEKGLILHHLKNQDTDKLIEVVHKIHGAAKYTGTTNIARHAGFLETHLKDLGLEDADSVAEDLIEEIEVLLDHRQLISWPDSVDSSTTNA